MDTLRTRGGAPTRLNFPGSTSTRLDRVAEAILNGLARPNPVLPATIRATLGSTTLETGQVIRRVQVDLGGALLSALYLPPSVIQLDKPVFVMRQSSRLTSPWVVLATNYQCPAPPPIATGIFGLIDSDPGPDGVPGTGDEPAPGTDPLEGYVYDDDGRLLVEY